MADAAQRFDKWYKILGLKQFQRYYHINGEPLINARGYKTRLFTQFLPGTQTLEEVDKKQVIAMGHSICEQLNAMDTWYKTKMKVDPENFFFGEHLTVSDLIGSEDAFKDLQYSVPMGADNYYDLNKDTIRLYFRPGTLSFDQGTRMRAPYTEIDPKFWPSDQLHHLDFFENEPASNTNNAPPPEGPKDDDDMNI